MSKNDHSAVSTVRKAPRRRARISKVANARDSLRDFDKGREAFILTYGQFSSMDAIEAVLEKTGPANVAIATWTAAAADLSRSAEQLRNQRIRSLRFIVDRSFLTRQPGYATQIVRLFGNEAIRTTRVHAKFAIVQNEDWNVVMPTSMNLNENRRLEYLHVVDCPQLCGFFRQLVDEIFEEEPPGLGGNRDVPLLAGLEEIKPAATIEMGRLVSVGA